MVCFTSRRLVAEDASEAHLLTATRPGLHEAHASHGRFFYLSRAPTNLASSCSATRPVGHSPLYVAFAGGKFRLKPPGPIKRGARFSGRTLVWSQKGAKRILHSKVSTDAATPGIASSLPQLQPEAGGRSGTVGGMVSADGGRQSPVGRGRADIGHPRQPLSNTRQRSRLGHEILSSPSQPNGQKHNGQMSVLCDEKPVASGNGISIGISLAEEVLYLQGFDQNDSSSGNTIMLRGSLHLHVTKQAKVKSISLNFRGRAVTDWPEGIPPRRSDFRDVETIMNHTWPFFNAQFPQAEQGYCADLVHLAKGPSVSTSEVGVTASSFDRFYRPTSLRPDLRPRDANRLSLQLSQSRSLGKGESFHAGPTVAQKGFKIFQPGDYVYNFELPVDSRLPETINVALGSVKYELEALVQRSGAFRPNLVGTKEVLMVRAPAEGSLEQSEPIAISRNWEDQMHYDIVISGKSFPFGASLPIAFKLTPLAKVQCHRIKVCLTENIQYFTANKLVHRLEPTCQVQLFEKRADALSSSAYPGSTIRINAGGGIASADREAAAHGEEIVQPDAPSLLGNLDQDDASIGATEMEFNVKLPSCYEMKGKAKQERLHFDTTYQNIQVNHWIKVVMRLSKPDENHAGKRRHFEISIDSPIHILSCRATAANTSLPAYTTGKVSASIADEFDCGCPGAAMKRRNPPPPQVVSEGDSSDTFEPTPALSPHWTDGNADLNTPTLAHVHEPSSGVQNLDTGFSRPIHLLRNPSFNPPPFSEEESPPPLITPPPKYENIVQGDSRNALADYFARLADEMADEDEHGDPGRVQIPLTPGGRVNRSMDASRTWSPLGTPTSG